MSSPIQIPSEFRYVGAAIMSTVVVLLGQGFAVGRYRRRAGIRYPQLYAEQAQVEKSRDAFVFNCAQRAHQNTLENIPIVWATTIIVGTQMPILAASICGLWSLSRVSYTFGYLSGDPAKRTGLLYSAASLGLFGLVGTATVYAALCIWEGVSTRLGF